VIYPQHRILWHQGLNISWLIVSLPGIFNKWYLTLEYELVTSLWQKLHFQSLFPPATSLFCITVTYLQCGLLSSWGSFEANELVTLSSIWGITINKTNIYKILTYNSCDWPSRILMHQEERHRVRLFEINCFKKKCIFLKKILFCYFNSVCYRFFFRKSFYKKEKLFLTPKLKVIFNIFYRIYILKNKEIRSLEF
jgi:hypothetical protein